MKAVKIILATIFAAAALAVDAVEVTPEQAETAVKNWINRSSRRIGVVFRSAKAEAVETVKGDSGRAIYHAMNLDGGGFVVTAGDTRQSPIVAFSATGRYQTDESNPLFAILKREQANVLEIVSRNDGKDAASGGALRGGALSAAEVEWAELLADERLDKRNLDAASKSSVSDVRVSPLIRTKWGQSNWGNYSNQPTAFNYSTPNNYVCGCVATAGAQIMKFWEAPKYSVASFSNPCQLNHAIKTYSSIAGAFDWSNMPLSYDSTPNIADAQRQALGMLTYNIGVAVAMDWTGFSSGSAAYTGDLITALTSKFGYVSGFYVTYNLEVGGTTGLTSFRNALYASLDAAMPVVMSIGGGSDGGHAVVADGYGYSSGTLYTHLNMGWDGSDDVWYLLVDETIYCSEQNFTFPVVNAIGFNIHPTDSGDVVSGRITTSSGIAVSGATVELLNSSKSQIASTTSNAKGIYSFRVASPGQYYVRASSGDATSSDASVYISAMSSTGRYESGGKTGNMWGMNLTLGVASNSDAYDPGDDTAAGGTWLSPTKAEQVHGQHTLSQTDPYDYFRIAVTAGRTYVFVSTGSSDMYGELFDSDNEDNRVAYDDDGGDGQNFKIEYTPEVSTTLYLKVRSFTVGTEASYSLKYSYSGGAQPGTYVRVEGYSNVNCTLGPEAVHFMSKVDCDGAWSVSVDDTSWGLVLETSGGVGDGYFYFTVPENTGYNRSCVFTVTSGSLAAYKNLTQYGPLGDKPDAWDPGDDTAAGGTSIVPSATEKTHGPHTFSSTDNYDFFRVSLTAGKTYVFESVGSSDTYGELFNSTSADVSQCVAYDDDSGDGQNFKIECTPSTSGTFYLRVRMYSAGARGSYTLRYYCLSGLSEFYAVTYRKYDGSGETASEDFECEKTYTLAWLGSDLGWARPGYEFVGWVPWNPDTKPRLCKYVNGQPVKDLATAGETINLWAGWKSSSSYRVCFHRCAGPDDLTKMNQVILRNKEDNLAWMDSQIGWSRKGYTFMGWSESEGSKTVKYANGAKVKNLAMNGGTKHLYAVWRADNNFLYKVRFNKYDGTGATSTEMFQFGKEQRLLWMDSQLGWSREGYEFCGWVPWNPESKPRLCKYVNGQLVVDLVSDYNGVLPTVNLWAAWKSKSSYRVCLNRNDGTGVKMNQVILRNKEDNLAWMDSMIGWKREGYVFKGWAESASGAVKYANGAKVKNLAMDGGTKHLYAIWRVAD